MGYVRYQNQKLSNFDELVLDMYKWINHCIEKYIVCLGRNQDHLFSNWQFRINRAEQEIRSQTIDKTMAKPGSVVRTQDVEIGQ